MKKTYNTKHIVLVAALCLNLLLVFSLASPACALEKQKLYIAYNIWLHKGGNMKFINFKSGSEFIPAGTEVKEVEIVEPPSGTYEDPYVTFTRVDNKKKYAIHFERRYHPHKSIEDYKEMTFTPKNSSELTKGFTENELAAITKGTVVDGLSREAVLVSYGYPPEHRTNVQSDNTWTYWMSKRQQKRIAFDGNGYTINTGKPALGKWGNSATAAAAANQASANKANNVAERLEILEKLKKQGLITPEEHKEKRAELLRQL